MCAGECQRHAAPATRPSPSVTLVRLARSLLWIDCAGGLTVGAFVLNFTDWLAALYAFPVELVRVMGTANLLYGAFSLSLARRAVRPRALLVLLVSANITWAVLCAAAVVVLAAHASRIGLATLLFESVYVGGLGALEWKHRALLGTRE